jgi:carotenoid cleavage dioxygenase
MTLQIPRNFGPVSKEVFREDLKVVAGALPPGLDGVFLRIGPNPYFKPVGGCVDDDDDVCLLL